MSRASLTARRRLPEFQMHISSDELSVAATTYQQTFGHAVPVEVLQLFVQRPGPLVMEIRQAIALQRPVPAWLARSRTPSAAPPTSWMSGS